MSAPGRKNLPQIGKKFPLSKDKPGKVCIIFRSGGNLPFSNQHIVGLREICTAKHKSRAILFNTTPNWASFCPITTSSGLTILQNTRNSVAFISFTDSTVCILP